MLTNTSIAFPLPPAFTNRKQESSMSVDVIRTERFEKVDYEPKSRSIPIQKYMQRTPSELQLDDEHDEVVADYRDYCMYSRIVSGISRQQMKHDDLGLRDQNVKTIENIMRTRFEQSHQRRSLTNQGIMNIFYQTSVDIDDDWAPDLVEARSTTETEWEQSQTVFELEL
jgi:ribosome-binding protein aMBF1 (putative translation factor)